MLIAVGDLIAVVVRSLAFVVVVAFSAVVLLLPFLAFKAIGVSDDANFPGQLAALLMKKTAKVSWGD